MPPRGQHLLPCDPAGTVYEGFVTPRQPSQCPHLWLRVTNVLPASRGGLSAACLECGPGLQELLKGREALLAQLLGFITIPHFTSPHMRFNNGGMPILGLALQRCARCPSVEVLLEELQELIDDASCERQARQPPDFNFYNAVFMELDLLGWKHVVDLAQDCTLLVLQTWDAAGREHRMCLQLPSTFPHTPPVLSSPLDLPTPLQLRWPSQGMQQEQLSQHRQKQRRGMFEEAVRQLEEALYQYQELWSCLEDFDQHTVVLEPACTSQHRDQGKGSHRGQLLRAQHAPALLRGGGAVCFRRVALGRHCSMEVTLDPLNPRAQAPQVRFLGPPDVVGPLHENLYSKLQDWEDIRSPRENLEQLLRVSFPRAMEATGGPAEACAAECAICYAYYLKAVEHPESPGDAPEVFCETARCGRPFHRRCLLEWLHALDETTNCFETLFGKCPYCSNSISVKA